MNKFTLKFQSEELESRFQKDQLGQIKKPIYIFMIIASLFINLGVLGFHFFSAPVETWYLNAAFSLVCLVQIIVILIMKQLRYFQFAVTLTNILIGFLELNVDPATTTNSEFYGYGNVFGHFTVILYSISDFPHTVFQIIAHGITRIAITIILSNKVDYLLIGVGIISVILLLITVYISSKSSRGYYLQTLKDHYYEQISSFLINKPYVKLSVNQNQPIFQVHQQNQIERFPGYKQNYCYGCNTRHLLRKYQLFFKQNLEHCLYNKQLLQLPGQFSISFKKRQYNIRVCELDISQLSYIIILESKQTLQKDSNTETLERRLELFLKRKQIQFHQKMFNWGVLSVVLLHKRNLKKLNFQKLLSKLIHVYTSKIYNRLHVEMHFDSEEQENLIYTFSNQLKIFLIQFLETLILMKQHDSSVYYISLHSDNNQVQMMLSCVNSTSFMKVLETNYFIKSTIDILTENNSQTQNTIMICFKNYPQGSFYSTKV